MGKMVQMFLTNRVRRVCLAVGCCLSVLLLTANARGQITLNVDTANETLFFTGADIGAGGNINAAIFEADAPALATFFDFAPDLLLQSGGVTLQPLDINFGLREPGFPTTEGNTAGAIELAISIDQSLGAINISGTDNRFSYALLPDAVADGLESIIGSEFQLVSGTGFSNIAVVSAVPEPSSASLLLVLAGSAILRRRKR